MTVEHVSAETPGDELAEILGRDGCVVVDNLIGADVVDAVMAEMQPFIEANGFGPDSFTGKATKRTGGMVARSATARDLVMHPTILAATAAHLGHATNYQLHLTQVISLGPGSPSQPVHRDQWAFDFFAFPQGYEVQCNTLWAGTDFTESNGATRVVVGSNHHADGMKYELADTEPAEMTKGSVLLYTGSIYHGGGANTTDATRQGINITYNVAWLRQEENQYLSVPPDIAAGLDDDLLRLLGYDRAAYALGYVDDLRDPLSALRDDAGPAGLGNVRATRDRINDLRA